MNKRLLFVDDEQAVLDALRRLLRPHGAVWDVVCVADPHEAWSQIQQGGFDLVVSDIGMPGMSGLELLERIKRSDRLQDIPVVMLTGLDSRLLKRDALDLGATDLLNKPVEPEDLVARLRNALRLKECQDQLKANNDFLEHTLQRRTAELNRSRLEVIWRLGKAAEHRDSETGNHVLRVGWVSRVVGHALGMDQGFVDTLFVAAPMHDIGKIGIPDAILTKPGPLTADEWRIMQQHCRIGADILQDDGCAAAPPGQWPKRPGGTGGEASGNPVLPMAARIALMHHEKWDGTGYPQGFAGEQIAVEARIVAIADVFDALTSRRPYKAALSESKALKVIDELAGSHFDPRVYAAFRESLAAIRAVRAQFPDGACLSHEPEEAGDEADLVCR